MLTKGALGNLVNRYRAVLKKCHLLNTFGSLTIATALFLGGAGQAHGAEYEALSGTKTITTDVKYTGNANPVVLSQAQSGNCGILNFSGSQISLSTSGTGDTGQIVGVSAKGLSTNLTTINLGAAGTTQDITVNVAAEGENYGSIGIWAYGNPKYVGQDVLVGGQVNIAADTVKIVTSGSWSYGVLAQNCTTTGTSLATININAGKTYLDTNSTDGAAIVAMSQGIIDIAGDLYVNTLSGSSDAIIARGDAQVTVNKDGTGEVQLNGNINFNYDAATSGTKVDADVSVTLSGANSYWKGNTLVSWGTGTPPQGMNEVSGMQLIIQNDATWNATSIQDAETDPVGQSYVALNDLTLDAGNIDVAEGAAVTVNQSSGQGTLNNNGEVTLKSTGNDTLTLAVTQSADASLTLAEAMKTTVTSYSGEGTLTNAGDLTFSGDIAAENATVTNTGGITVASGTTRLGSGYTQTSGSLTVASGATLESQGTLQVSGGTVTFTDDSVFAVDAARVADSAAVLVSDSGSLDVASGAVLRIDNAMAGETYDIVDGSDQSWITIQTSSDMLDPSMGADGKVVFAAKDASQVYTGIDGDLGALISAMYMEGLNDVNSDALGVRFLSRATDSRYNSGVSRGEKTMKSAAHLVVAGVVPQMARAASDAASNAVAGRLGFALPYDGVQAVNVAGDDCNGKGLALWISPLWQSINGFGLEAGNMDYDFNGNLGGIAIGADYTWDTLRAGITFNLGAGYAEGSGDFADTTNNMTFWGVGFYGGWRQDNFGLMADVSYTSTWNSVEQDLDAGLGMGSEIEADIQASAITAALRAEYRLQTAYLDLIPHASVRYMHVNVWGYDAEISGGTLYESDGMQQNIWTFPVGVTLTKDIQMGNGWVVAPMVDLSVIPAAGDIEGREDLEFTGLPASIEMEAHTMDYLTWQGQAGVKFTGCNVSLGLNYTLQAGAHTTNHGIAAAFRYEF